MTLCTRCWPLWLVVWFCLSANATLAASRISLAQYVDQYKQLAILEMHRTGIPASIKLGQAIMESEHGNSELARNSNNHFGIKCKAEWAGSKYFHKDDDRNAKGELIHSCFRVYGSVAESYLDHSAFLLSRERYAVLFDLPTTDYRAWAAGLKACGYATAAHYADKLIRIIETHELYRLDVATAPSVLPFSRPKPPTLLRPDLPLDTPLKGKTVRLLAPTSEREAAHDLLYRLYGPCYFPYRRSYGGTFLVNGKRAVALKEGQSLEMLAAAVGEKVHRLRAWNDLPDGMQPLRRQYIFLERKADAHLTADAHRCVTGQTLYVVAQLYGIKLERLRAYNPASEPWAALDAGTLVYLNAAAARLPAHRLRVLEQPRY